MASTSLEFCGWSETLTAVPLFFSAGIQSSACLDKDNLLDPEQKEQFSGYTVAGPTLFTICESDAFRVKWVKLLKEKTVESVTVSRFTYTSWLRFESKKQKNVFNSFGLAFHKVAVKGLKMTPLFRIVSWNCFRLGEPLERWSVRARCVT